MVYVSGPDVAWDIEARSRQFPDVRFVLLKQEAPIGEWINLAMQETRSPLVMVLWSNIRFAVEAFTPELLQSLAAEQAVCVVPRMQTERGDAVPTVHMPVFIRRRPRIIPLPEVRDRMMCLYPYDYCGVYARERFLRVGGFDPQVANPYWQKLDFGFRCFLWGERIVLRTASAVHALRPARDRGHHARRGLQAHLPQEPGGRRAPRKAACCPGAGSPPTCSAPTPARSPRGASSRRRTRWVEANRVRFRREARTLADLWELPE